MPGPLLRFAPVSPTNASLELLIVLDFLAPVPAGRQALVGLREAPVDCLVGQVFENDDIETHEGDLFRRRLTGLGVTARPRVTEFGDVDDFVNRRPLGGFHLNTSFVAGNRHDAVDAPWGSVHLILTLC